MKNLLIKILPILFLFLLTIVFFAPVLKGKIPFAGDTLIGGYLPWRNIAWEGRDKYPVKNMTITDAANSFYPWRFEAIRQLKQGVWPLWNRFEFSGNPLLANPSTAAFYPLNIFFLFMTFNWAWALQVVIQPLLAGLFLYLFLKNKGLSVVAAIFGSVCFSWGSYLLTVVEFNVLGNTALWFPLILLSIDKLFDKKNIWFLVLIFSLIMTILGGFFQFVFYEFIVMAAYTIFLLVYKKDGVKEFVWILLGIVVSILFCSFQILPFLELVKESSRIGGYGNLEVITNFFVPLRQLIMFFAPDFFGNPGTANYWGAINYYEFCGYIGIPAMFFVFYLIYMTVQEYLAIYCEDELNMNKHSSLGMKPPTLVGGECYSKKQNREVLFWVFSFLFSIILVVKNPISLLPYNLRLPFLSSLIPARLLLVSTFSLSLLAAYGVEKFIKNLKNSKKSQLINLIIPVFSLMGILLFLWYVGFKPTSFDIEQSRQSIILRNLVFPTILFGLSILLLILSIIFPQKAKIMIFGMVLLLSFDLQRQGNKFLPFIDQKLIYPEIGVTKFLKENLKYDRFLNTHQEVFGVNYQTVYGLESVEGYNPLHKYDYSIFVSMGESEKPVDSAGTKFERTVYGRKYQANIYNLLSVKYFLSLDNIISQDYPLVFQENEVKIYENKKTLPRVFFSCNWQLSTDPLEIINGIINAKNPGEKVYLDNNVDVKCDSDKSMGKAEIINNSSSRTEITVDVPETMILTFSDAYFPGWKVLIDGRESALLKVDYVLKGTVVPGGKHTVSFIYDPESFKIGLRITFITIIFISCLIIYKIKKRKNK